MWLFLKKTLNKTKANLHVLLLKSIHELIKNQFNIHHKNTHRKFMMKIKYSFLSFCPRGIY